MREITTKKFTLSNIDYLVIIDIFLIICVLYSSYINIIIHSLINIFAGGRSISKTIVFLLFILVLYFITKINKKNNIKIKLWQKLLLLGTFIYGFILNIVSYFLFINNYGIETNKWMIVFNNSEISSTSFLHNHVLKGAIGTILKIFNISYKENLDAGFVFTNTNLLEIYYFSIIILIVIIFWSLIYFFKAISNISLQKKPIFLIFYGIIIFSLTKNIVDGGLFNYEAFIGFAFLFLLLFPRKKWAIYTNIILIISYLILNFVFYFNNYFDQFENKNIGLTQNLVDTFIYISVLSILYYFQFNRIKRIGILLIILVLLLVYFNIYSDLSMINYRAIKITSDNNAIFASYDNINDKDYQKMGSTGDLFFYNISPKKTITVDYVLKQYEVDDNFYPLTFPYRNCFPHGKNDNYEYDLVTREEINIKEFNDSNVTITINQIEKNVNDNNYHIFMSIKSCLPRHINIVQEIWKTKEIGEHDTVHIGVFNSSLIMNRVPSREELTTMLKIEGISDNQIEKLLSEK